MTTNYLLGLIPLHLLIALCFTNKRCNSLKTARGGIFNRLPLRQFAAMVDTSPVEAEATNALKHQLSWTKQWYPVAIEDHLEPAEPQSVKLLGKTFVLWKDESGVDLTGSTIKSWRAIDEACPHRLASMSLGQVDSKAGTITCRYHGWEFNGGGNCTLIPMAKDDTSSRLALSKRSCIPSYPTQLCQGLVWVWPDDGPDRFLQAGLSPLPVLPEKDADPSRFSDWFVSEWPVDWLAMVENNYDPSHAMFLHQGPMFDPKTAQAMRFFDLVNASVVNAYLSSTISDDLAAAAAVAPFGAGSNADDVSKPVESDSEASSGSDNDNEESRADVSTSAPSAVAEKRKPFSSSSMWGSLFPEGFTVRHSGYSASNLAMNATRVFRAPCSSVVRYSYPKVGKITFAFHFVPTRPGYCKTFGYFSVGFFRPGNALAKLKSKAVDTLKRLSKDYSTLLKAASHSGSQLFHQDVSAMLTALFELDKRGKQPGGSWRNAYFLPTVADKGVISFRRWLDKFGGGGVGWIEDQQPIPGTVGEPESVTSQTQTKSGQSQTKSLRLPRLKALQLSDRWESHTRDCRHCRSALRIAKSWLAITNKIQWAAAAGVAVAALWRRVWLFALSAALVAASAVMKDWLVNLRHVITSTIPKDDLPELNLNYKDRTIGFAP